jgi:NTE family protein
MLRIAEIGYLGTSSHKINNGIQAGTLQRISSVSGGSITSAILGMNWAKVDVDGPNAGATFNQEVIGPVRLLASKTIDAKSILSGVFLPGSINKKIIKAYKKHLYGDRTLQVFPDNPRFVINATNLQSGALWRFMKPYIRDWKVGKIPNSKRTVTLAGAVAASSAFPPVLSPAKFEFKESDYEENTGGPGANNLQMPPYTTNPILSDGGVYDNLGLETVWKRFETILVSDAGGQMAADPKVGGNWASQGLRATSVIDNQVRSLRKRQVIDSFVDGTRTGAYWGIRSNIENFGLPDALPCPHDKTLELAKTATRLKELSDTRQKKLINWGYAVCDAAIRRHVDQTIRRPDDFPYPSEGVG